MIEPCTDRVLALEMPATKRVQNSMNALTASPDRNTMALKASDAKPTRRDRLKRSAR